ncbi:hypothetical protein I5Q34_01200 [Streptomyces sp. AV19]|uniref:hypothetical protein n=1 Tax=Streptomyces sp. AV19 TaxID=2793068 RepID=UPI0018FEBFFA|nr:hypothetical protein [Streptomyces sp. AV19]MBH1932921.1 hypothetical protein [Streptomyces sp. AV19]MDG4531671.1 hypothetical protein [Streptomyces sp. AV19]
MKSLRRLIGRIVGRRKPAVTGPVPIYVRRSPAGAVLDVESYAHRVITTLADEYLDELIEIAEDRANVREYDGHRPEGLLVERLAEAVGYELPLYGVQVTELADRLRAVAPAVRIPQQRAEGSAA